MKKEILERANELKNKIDKVRQAINTLDIKKEEISLCERSFNSYRGNHEEIIKLDKDKVVLLIQLLSHDLSKLEKEFEKL